MTTKTCTRCGLTKPADTSHFVRNRPNYSMGQRRPDTYHNTCRVCESAAKRASWVRRHEDRANYEAFRTTQLLEDAAAEHEAQARVRAATAQREAAKAQELLLRAQEELLRTGTVATVCSLLDLSSATDADREAIVNEITQKTAAGWIPIEIVELLKNHEIVNPDLDGVKALTRMRAVSEAVERRLREEAADENADEDDGGQNIDHRTSSIGLRFGKSKDAL